MSDPDGLDRSARFCPGWWILPAALVGAFGLGLIGAAVLAMVTG
jgi:hypothetical protein